MTAATTVELPQKRSGAGHWLASYRAMVRWQVTDMRLLLPLTVMVQALAGVGLVLGFGLLIQDMPETQALYLSTGAVVVTLVLVGVVMGPQLIAQQKSAGSYDFMWSLPVPRSSAAAAWVSLNTLIAVPGMLGALIAASLRYGVSFDVTWMILPAVALTLVTGTLFGYALAHSIPNPEVTQLLSGLLIFVIFGFAPISYPIENLPDWLARLNEFLPFYPMAVVVRNALSDGFGGEMVRSYVVLGVWTVVAAIVSGAVLRRRK
jgi:ABC-2 type transport system permease protein